MVDGASETDYDFAGKYTREGRAGQYLIDRFYYGVAALMGRTGARRILEVGCGEGFSTRRIAAMLPPEIHFEASDIEPRLVDAARRRNPDLQISRESVFELERPDRSFDLVLCMEVLEHLEDPARALRELCRVSSGHILVTVPREPLWRILNFLRGKYVTGLGNTPGHLQHWSARAFASFVRTAADPVEIRTPIPWTQILARPR